MKGDDVGQLVEGPTSAQPMERPGRGLVEEAGPEPTRKSRRIKKKTWKLRELED